MHKGCKTGGFTIVEVMIVLALGSFMFFSVNSLLRGNQSQTEFNSGAQQIYSSMQSVNSDVENGVYNVPAGYHCFINSSNVPAFSKTRSDFGCVYLGKVFEFNPYAKATQYYVYTIVGDQFASVYKLPISLSSPNSLGALSSMNNDNPSYPTVYNTGIYKYPPDTSPPPGTQIFNLPYGFYVKSISYSSSIGTQGGTLGLVGFVNNITADSSVSISDKLFVRPTQTSFSSSRSSSVISRDLGIAIGDINSAGVMNRDYWDYSNLGSSSDYKICLVSNIEPNMSAKITMEQGSQSVNLSLNIINNNTCT
jgi:hypothetical protein